MRVSHRFGVGILLLSTLAASSSAAVYRVKWNASGSPQDGSTWDRAFTTVQAGINAAGSNDEVWIAQGTYLERVTLKDNVKLRGGYAGTGASPDERNYDSTPTILDGNKGGSVIKVAAYAGHGTLIEGLTIRNGTGTAPSGSSVFGGGVYCDSHAAPTITFCNFMGNEASPANWPVGRGGAIWCDEYSQPIIENNRFSGSSALYGGALFVWGGSIRNNVFDKNSAVATGGAITIGPAYTATVTGNAFTGCGAFDGGAIYCDSSDALIMSNVFTNCYANGQGGAIDTLSAAVRIVSNNFFGNRGGTGDAIYMDGAIAVINNTIARSTNSGTDVGAVYLRTGFVYNNIFLNNQVAVVGSSTGTHTTNQFRNNCFYGNTTDVGSYLPVLIGNLGNFHGDPKVADPAGTDMHILATSPCVDAGDDFDLETGDTDIDGQARVIGGKVDIGSDEMSPVLVFTTQPGDGRKGEALLRQPVISLKDSAGNPYTTGTGTVYVTLTAGTGTPGAALGGTSWASFVSGVATFTNLSVNTGGTGYTLSTSTEGLAGITSSAFNVVIPRVYVTTSGNDSNEGSSWAAAKKTVGAAIDGVDQPGEIWVKAGTYSGNVTLPANVALLGGFRGGESVSTNRHPDIFTTTLDSVLTAPVVTIGAGAGRSTVLDGFTVTGGAGKQLGLSPNIYRAGGGIYMKGVSPTITRNVITTNTATIGAGIYIEAGSPLIQYNKIAGNTAACTLRITGGGAGIALLSGSTAGILDNVINNNAGTGTNPVLAEGARGGGIGCASSSPAIRNNTIASNTTTGKGGAIYLNDASPALSNNVIALNGTGVFGEAASHPSFRCNDLYSNGAYNTSGLTNPIGSNGNISADPLFLDAASKVYILAPGSPCINAGDMTLVDAGETDHDGDPRVTGSSVDMGAYEMSVFSTSDVKLALRIAAGLVAGSTADVTRLDVAPAARDGLVTLLDAMRLARKVAGTEANP